MLIAKSYHHTHEKESYDSFVYDGLVVLKIGTEQLTLDMFDIKSLMETLFLSLSPTQKKNMIEILTNSHIGKSGNEK